MHGLRHHCSELVEPLRKLVDLSSEVFGDLDPSGLRIQAEDLVLQVCVCVCVCVSCLRVCVCVCVCADVMQWKQVEGCV